MNVKTVASVFTLGLAVGSMAIAQSLVSKLPADGSWADYTCTVEETGPDGKKSPEHADITIRSVGVSAEGNPMIDLRWLEVDMRFVYEGERVQIVDKILIPESVIGIGNNPRAAIRKWWKMDSRNGQKAHAVDPSSPDGGDLELVVLAPLETVQALDDLRIETKHAVFDCKATIGTRVGPDDGSGAITYDQYIAYLNDTSPFGTVALKINRTEKRGGELISSMKISITLTEFGTGAKSELITE